MYPAVHLICIRFLSVLLCFWSLNREFTKEQREENWTLLRVSHLCKISTFRGIAWNEIKLPLNYCLLHLHVGIKCVAWKFTPREILWVGRMRFLLCPFRVSAEHKCTSAEGMKHDKARTHQRAYCFPIIILHFIPLYAFLSTALLLGIVSGWIVAFILRF